MSVRLGLVQSARQAIEAYRASFLAITLCHQDNVGSDGSDYIAAIVEWRVVHELSINTRSRRGCMPSTLVKALWVSQTCNRFRFSVNSKFSVICSNELLNCLSRNFHTKELGWSTDETCVLHKSPARQRVLAVRVNYYSTAPLSSKMRYLCSPRRRLVAAL